MTFHSHQFSRKHLRRTIVWSLLISSAIVVAAAALGRAARNFQSALVSVPDVAVHLLLKDEGITSATFLRGNDTERDYLVRTTHGSLLAKLMKGEQWYVARTERLHEMR